MDMFEQLTTISIVTGGILGMAFGIYGIAPMFFRGRLQRRTAARPVWGEYEDDPLDGDHDDDDYESGGRFALVMEARRRAQTHFDLPQAWQSAPLDSAPRRTPDLHLEHAARQEPSGHHDWLSAPIDTDGGPRPLDPILPPEELDEVLDIFREVLPREPSLASKTLAAFGGNDGASVRIQDLLADARWTVRSLFQSGHEVATK